MHERESPGADRRFTGIDRRPPRLGDRACGLGVADDRAADLSGAVMAGASND